MPSIIEMQTTIQMYTPKGLYGFLSNPDGKDIYFHLSVFDPGSYVGDSPVPPIIGELVDTFIEDGRVIQCCRVETPILREGVVQWFDSDKGYGFIDFGGEQVFLHRSEVLHGRLPLKGRRVSFYITGIGESPLRACHISVLSE